jgi:hypothetical protein
VVTCGGGPPAVENPLPLQQVHSRFAGWCARTSKPQVATARRGRVAGRNLARSTAPYTGGVVVRACKTDLLSSPPLRQTVDLLVSVDNLHSTIAVVRPSVTSSAIGQAVVCESL